MSESFLHATVVYLSAAVIAVPIAQRLGLGSVLGYLMAGIVIGPWGMGLIDDVDAVLHFSEFGVVLLLFLIGLELDPKTLWKMRSPILGLGGGQVVISTVLIAMIAVAITVAAGMLLSWQQALIIGMGLALSSTAIALRIIDEQGLGGSESGQSGFSILLFQDIAVIPMLAVLPILAGGSGGDWIEFIWTLAGFLGLLVAGHYLLRPLFRWVVLSGVRELFNVAALLLVIGIALAMEQLGLSMALGTFLAGVLLAESEYRHELEIAIEPFKGLLLGLFFISVGMTVNLELFVEQPLIILGCVAALIAIKMAVLYGLARLWKIGSKSRSQLSVILSQGGEFAFVLFTAARAEGALDAQLHSFLLVVVSLSMVTTPILLLLQNRWFARELNSDEVQSHDSDVVGRESRVIIAGFGRFGQIIGRLLYANKIKLTILERDPSQIQMLRKFGYKVFYGDATQLDLLRAAGADKAEAIVICSDSPDDVMKIVEICQHYFPHLKILSRARSRVDAHQLLNHNVDGYTRETFLGALDLGRKTLTSLGMHPYRAKRAEEHFHRLDSQLLREFTPEHNEDVALASRTKEARKELEEIFDREMRSDKDKYHHWNVD
ncbi:glutathione-regulated potassium-efflux system protein KefB [Vibrio sp. SS-MA-C1-2]|uniref:glutathione-regulated potassium-efflux system protein KefB n=1 Tax=Vibrio sp. SS-MA-C1-2 TaxID=2908646 RepID=UPI001F36D935|nr:glutathione-regulated potassium-efflux system protein KefB [Vibrio sp. SS-MA-C1-2]UJF19207.1 glutathione-regulated potassium-efflux system protein KefB [Vibrio sp. SS-MA-C1-2]